MSLSGTKVQGELWTNKQPSLRWRVSCTIQDRNNLRHSNSVLCDAKKVKETLTTILSRNTATETKTFVKLKKFAWWKHP